MGTTGAGQLGTGGTTLDQWDTLGQLGLVADGHRFSSLLDICVIKTVDGATHVSVVNVTELAVNANTVVNFITLVVGRLGPYLGHTIVSTNALMGLG